MLVTEALLGELRGSPRLLFTRLTGTPPRDLSMH